MKLTFSIPATVTDADTGDVMVLREDVCELRLCEEKIADYLDFAIADLGVVGGEVYWDVTDGISEVTVEFWTPTLPSTELTSALRKEVVAQFEDGMGEGGFPVDVSGISLIVIPDCDRGMREEISDDGRVIESPSRIAIASRDGDLVSLRCELESTTDSADRRLQGYAPLHLAILYGHIEVVELLLAAGADPNLIDARGQSPIELCALTTQLSDDESQEIARMLLAKGAQTCHLTANCESALSYALMRQKHRLAELLR
jgi:hypothetical protein